jgi:UPF0176 protein
MLNIAFYRFNPIADPAALRAPARERASAAGLKGTVIFSPEGINGFLAGEEPAVRDYLAWLRTIPGFETMEAKESISATQPFGKLFIKVKREIIPFGEGIAPHVKTARHLESKELKRWLDEGRDIVLLDTRNEYEIKDGTFRGAKSLGLDHFRHFPQALKNAPAELAADLATKPVVMFCTGGIRCEKAAAYAENLGLCGEVYQLEGGILKYFEETGGAHYDGTCFVFDERGAVDGRLSATARTS